MKKIIKDCEQLNFGSDEANDFISHLADILVDIVLNDGDLDENKTKVTNSN